jgi:hypothetical protein
MAASLFSCGHRVKQGRYGLVKLMYQCNQLVHVDVSVRCKTLVLEPSVAHRKFHCVRHPIAHERQR